MSSQEKNSHAPSCEFTENLNVLRQTYFFSGLPLESLKVFAYLCTRETYHSGDYLFRQNEDDGQAFYLVRGRARVERTDKDQTREIRTFGAGQFIGGLTLLGETRRLYSLKAIEDVVSIVLGREKFTRAIQQFPDQMPRIFKAVVTVVDDWEERFLTERADDCGGCLPNLGVSLL
jgi:CRP-like cAMP-binding protein